eukprot:595019-Prymnesium_polylepis.1
MPKQVADAFEAGATAEQRLQLGRNINQGGREYCVRCLVWRGTKADNCHHCSICQRAPPTRARAARAAVAARFACWAACGRREAEGPVWRSRPDVTRHLPALHHPTGLRLRAQF